MRASSLIAVDCMTFTVRSLLHARLYTVRYTFTVRRLSHMCVPIENGILRIILGVHDMQQASRKAEFGDHKHAVNDT